MNFDEQNIIERCRKNDRLAQELLYRRFFAPMMRLCMRYARGDRERALEILNNGMLRVFQKIDSFEGRGSLEGWVRKLVFHAISDYYRYKSAEILIFEEELPPEAHILKTENAAQNNLYFDDLVQLVEQLPPATRDVFRLYALDGFNHAEIAEQLKISVGTSKWHLSAAREKLKGLIASAQIMGCILLYIL